MVEVSGTVVSDSVAPPLSEHGGDGRRVASALGLDPSDLIDLSASLNPFAPDVAALAARHLDSLKPYPDSTAATTCLADAVGVDRDRVILTNGGAEAIALVADLLGQGSVVEPEFSLYRRHLRSVTTSGERWRSNPSNPLGKLAQPDEAAAVWDEAFYPLATGLWTRGDDAAWRLGSLTKLWACAGLRLGYIIAPDGEQATHVRVRQPQWSVNGLALALVPELLARTDLTVWSHRTAEFRSHFAAQLRQLGFGVTESAANWVLVEGVNQLRRSLVPHGVLVRDCTNFGLADTVRVALPLPSQLDRVLCAFAQCSAG